MHSVATRWICLGGILVTSGTLMSQQLYDLPGYTVNADAWPGIIPSSELQYLPATNSTIQAHSLAGMLEAIPGVYFQRRGAGAWEPNIRGFAMDRLTTTFNGHYLPIAAPTHTASPVNFFGPALPATIEVIKGSSPVSRGSVPTGGRIDVNTYSRISHEPLLMVAATHNPDGFLAAVHGNPLSATSGVNSMISAYSVRAGDYRAGDGDLVVDEDYSAAGVTGSFRFNPCEESELRFAVNYQSQQKANNPSLPMDVDGAEALFVTIQWIQEMGDNIIDLSFGYAAISQALSTSGRTIDPVAPIRLISAQADAESFSMRAEYEASLPGNLVLSCGVDYVQQERDALRKRHLKSGSTLKDYIWPQIEVRQPGVFFELSMAKNRTFEWLIGARAEKTSMDAKRADEPVIGVPGSVGPTIADDFAVYNGSAVSGLSRIHWTRSLQSYLQKHLSDKISLIAAAEYSVAPPGPGETYRAFLNALGGGIELGNPQLLPERKQQASLGVYYNHAHLELSAQAWWAQIHDFVVRTVIVKEPLLYSFRNIDSRFSGWDLTVSIRPFQNTILSVFSCRLAYSRTVGREDASRKRLPEVPPWEANLSMLWNNGFGAGPLSIEMDFRFTGSAVNPQPERLPVFKNSASYMLVNTVIHYRMTQSLIVSLGVENLLDELAYSYLQPPVSSGFVFPSGGTLKPGDRIPLPGRSISLVARWNF